MEVIQFLYLGAGIVFSLAFVPQIINLCKDKSGAVSVSITTWGLFSICSVITLLYAVQVNHDANFMLTALLGTLGNLTVLGLAVWRRITFQKHG